MFKNLISSKVAVETAQKVNRDAWLRNAADKLNEQILNAANEGKRELRVNLQDMIQGAENMYEAGEMLVLLSDALNQKGYQSVITFPCACCVITW